MCLTAADLRAIVRRERKGLRPFEVVPDPPYRLSRQALTGVYPKQCYVRAYRYAANHFETQALLVHGLYHDGKGHAWVEIPGGVVYDGVLNRFYQAEPYHLVKMTVPEAKYTPKEASEKGDAAWHFGPWHSEPEATRGDSG